MTDITVKQFHLTSKDQKPPEVLLALTHPLTSKIIQLDEKVVYGWSLKNPEYENITSMVRADCERNETMLIISPSNPEV